MRFVSAGYEKKTGMRLSTSLQDFSVCHDNTFQENYLERGDEAILLRDKIVPMHLQRENLSSSFSKEKFSVTALHARRRWLRIAAGFVCLSLILLLLYVCLRHPSIIQHRKSSHFSVILDSGSTGTRVYVYEWKADRSKDHGHLPLVVEPLPSDPQKKPKPREGRAYRRMETEPGFDKLLHNSSGLKSAIQPLLLWAEKQVPGRARSSTPLYLYATAGLRRLPAADSKWLLDNAWSILGNSSFSCQRNWVKIISGTEEAYYGWIALNYHLSTLGFGPPKATFGSLDLGGSSLQVTFETHDMLYDKTSLNLSIGEVQHHLNAYSLSGYGLNDAFDKSVAYLLKKQVETRKAGGKDVIKVDHPCLQNGYREKYVCSNCIQIDGEDNSGAAPTGKQSKSGTVVSLHGTSKWEDCALLAKSAVNLSEWSVAHPGLDCAVQPCALSADLPTPLGQFYAMSGFYVVYRFFNLSSEATLDALLQKGREFCKKTWKQAKRSVVAQPFVEQYCFRSPYVVSLLRDGLHLEDRQVVIGSGSITWTLGVALVEAGAALSKGVVDVEGYAIFHQKLSPIFIIAILIVSLLIIIFFIACTRNGTPRCFRRPYLPLIGQSSGTSSPFRINRWSPLSSRGSLGLLGESRVKMPLSPTVTASDQRPFGSLHGVESNVANLTEASPHPLVGGVAHSFSTSSLGQMQIDNGGGSFWTPHRSQMRLQSRRSQSREDLNSSVADAHMVKV